MMYLKSLLHILGFSNYVSIVSDSIFTAFDLALKAHVSQEILNWHSLRHSHSAEF